MTTIENIQPLATRQMSRATCPGTVTQAVIMAGGKGTRLHPYSALLPKPLMPLDDMPILELLLRQMQRAGITDVLVAVNHLGHLIKAFFGDGSKLGVSIRYISEDKPLGTAGALGNMLDLLDESFLLSNGDLLTSMDIGAMARQHFETEADATIGVFQRENKIDFGIIEFDAENRLSAYREKPKNVYYVSMGIYILQHEAILPHIMPGEYFDVPSLMLALRGANRDVRCYRDDGMWLDIGRPDDFAMAQTLFEQNRGLFLR